VSSQPESTLVERTAQAVAQHPVAVEVGNEPNLLRYWGATITRRHNPTPSGCTRT
jgi:hypothetical protein